MACDVATAAFENDRLAIQRQGIPVLGGDDVRERTPSEQERGTSQEVSVRTAGRSKSYCRGNSIGHDGKIGAGAIIARPRPDPVFYHIFPRHRSVRKCESIRDRISASFEHASDHTFLSKLLAVA